MNSPAVFTRQLQTLRRDVRAIKPQKEPKTAVEMADELGIALDPWQHDVLSTDAREVLMLCSRQAGKSMVAALLALHQAVHVPASLTIIVSPTERQSKLLLKSCRRFYWKLHDAPRSLSDNKLSLELGNGSEIHALPGDEEGIRGFSSVSLIVEDEAAIVPDDLYQSVRPMLAVSGGRIVLLSSPRGKRGHFYYEFTNGGPSWHRAMVKAEQCPRIPAAFLAEERAKIGDFWYRQEYGCEFVDDESQLFPSDLVDDAITPDVQPLALPRLQWSA